MKTIELFIGNDSPTGDFQPLGKIETQNVKMLRNPHQTFGFDEVTARFGAACVEMQ